MTNLTSTSDWLAEKIASIEDEQGNAKFHMLGDNLGGKGLPLVAWRLKKQEAYDGTNHGASLVVDVISDLLTQNLLSLVLCALAAGSVSYRYMTNGLVNSKVTYMIVPAYTMAPHAETLKLLRVVVREDFSLRRAQTFLRGKYSHPITPFRSTF